MRVLHACGEAAFRSAKGERDRSRLWSVWEAASVPVVASAGVFLTWVGCRRRACVVPVAGGLRLCPPNPYPSAAVDWISATAISERAQAAWFETPDLMAWLERSRLNVARGINDHRDEPQMQSALARYLTDREPAIDRFEHLLAPAREPTAAGRLR